MYKEYRAQFTSHSKESRMTSGQNDKPRVAVADKPSVAVKPPVPSALLELRQEVRQGAKGKVFVVMGASVSSFLLTGYQWVEVV